MAEVVDEYAERKARAADRLLKADKLANEVGLLRIRGLTFRQAADHLHVSLGATHKAWGRYRRSLVRGDTEGERVLALARLEGQYLDLQPKLRTGDPAAHRAATEIVQLMSDLQGLSMPTQVDVGVHGRVFTRFEFVTEQIPGAQPPQVEEDPRVPLLGPAEVTEAMEVSR